MAKKLQGLSIEARATFWRSLQALNLSRLVIGAVLLLYVSVEQQGWRGAVHAVQGQVCLAYLLLAGACALLTQHVRRRFLRQLMAQMALDIAVISVLYESGGGARSGLAILYLLPLAAAGMLAPLLLALFWSALVVLFLLVESSYHLLLIDGQEALLQAGLYGAALFALVLLLSRMSARLLVQEELAREHASALSVQQAINRLVVADMGDGVVVLGAQGLIVSANPAAQRMLGLTGSNENILRLSAIEALAPLAQAHALWRLNPENRCILFSIKPGSDPAAHTVSLKARFACVDMAGLSPDPGLLLERSVIFLQDASAIEHQAQQLKLASMGRLTASIAHEVRNPLSAIGHAAELLREEASRPDHLRLLHIIGANVARLNRMVEDILQLSRKAQFSGEGLLLVPFLLELVAEFKETHGLADGVIGFTSNGAVQLRFDALHLREIVVNLLNNALRYCSGAAGSMALSVLAAPDARSNVAPNAAPQLQVQDDGPAILPEVRAHLFEPFYTSSGNGCGLGLYLARELCLNNQATLDYECRSVVSDGKPSARGCFIITFSSA